MKIPIRFDEVTGTQFTKELHVWEGLHHKNIVEIYAANIFPVPYIEMEYVKSALAAMQFPLETKQAVEIVKGVAEGLRYAHEQGIVHRDIKPGNIMITPGGYTENLGLGTLKSRGDKTVRPHRVFPRIRRSRTTGPEPLRGARSVDGYLPAGCSLLRDAGGQMYPSGAGGWVR